MNIVLVGMRGTGKSNISRRLSVLSKYPVLSTDLLIRYDSDGRSIPDIVADRGWAHFRDLERAVLAKCRRISPAILDCGGGVLVDVDAAGDEHYSAHKVDLLRAAGTIVWLRGDIPRLAAKTRSDESRPSLHAVRSAEEVMRRRLPFFERAADVTYDIEGVDRKELARRIHADLIATYGAEAADSGPDIPGA